MLVIAVLTCRFDFRIELYGKMMYLEYDGEQHYKPKCFGGMSKEKAQEAFIKTQKHDQIKNKHCEDNDIPLLRIPFFRFEETYDLVTDFIDANLYNLN